MTTELLEVLETTIKRFHVTPDRAAELQPAGDDNQDRTGPSDEVTVTWQRVTGCVPSLLVTVPASGDCWAVPVPHRPGWLMDLIVKNAPEWWMK